MKEITMKRLFQRVADPGFLPICLLLVTTSVFSGCREKISEQGGSSAANDQSQAEPPKTAPTSANQATSSISSEAIQILAQARQQIDNASSDEQREDAKAFSEELEKIVAELDAWVAVIEKMRAEGTPITKENSPPYPSVFTSTMEGLVFAPDESEDPNQPTSPNEGSEQQKEMQQMLISLAAAGLCIYQPYLCPLAMIIASEMGVSSDDVLRDADLLSSIESSIQQDSFDPETIRKITGKIEQLSGRNLPDGLIEQLTQLPGALQDSETFNDLLTQKVIEAAARQAEAWERIQDQFPTWVTTVVEAIVEKKPDLIICQAFSQRDHRGPYFTDAAEKQLAKVAVAWAAARAEALGAPPGVKQRVWDGLLGKIGLQEEVNRIDPCDAP